MTAYSASKAGVIGLAKAVGKEYAETNVTVNALAPAVIRTGELLLLLLLFFVWVRERDRQTDKRGSNGEADRAEGARLTAR